LMATMNAGICFAAFNSIPFSISSASRAVVQFAVSILEHRFKACFIIRIFSFELGERISHVFNCTLNPRAVKGINIDVSFVLSKLSFEHGKPAFLKLKVLLRLTEVLIYKYLGSPVSRYSGSFKLVE